MSRLARRRGRGEGREPWGETPSAPSLAALPPLRGSGDKLRGVMQSPQTSQLANKTPAPPPLSETPTPREAGEGSEGPPATTDNYRAGLSATNSPSSALPSWPVTRMSKNPPAAAPGRRTGVKSAARARPPRSASTRKVLPVCAPLDGVSAPGRQRRGAVRRGPWPRRAEPVAFARRARRVAAKTGRHANASIRNRRSNRACVQTSPRFPWESRR